ncbi:MAG: NTP pyrophosphohydrolases including oxidative damage repair enzymes, partial [uncultured Frankineae bacterium]
GRRLRAAALRGRAGPAGLLHRRPARAAAGAQDEPLDVVRVPPGRGAGPQRAGSALRGLRAGRGPRLPRAPGPRSAAAGVRPRTDRAARVRPGSGPGTGRRRQAALVDDPVRGGRAGGAGVRGRARAVLRRPPGRADDPPAL